MKIKHIMLLFYILICTVFCGERGGNSKIKKYSTISPKYSEIKQIISQEVNDTFYIYTRLPKYYQNSNRRYPVLYLLDGDISYNMAISVVRYLQYGKDVPDLIIVAPAYGTLLSDHETNYRERDYTISKIERFNNSSGADKFTRFLQNELIPFVDSSYRTNNTRILNGYSLGGLFALNTLIEDSELFNNFIAGSPYLTDDISLLSDKLSELSSFRRKKRLFISVGEIEDNERYHVPISTIFRELQAFDKLEIKFITFKEGTHFTCPSEALAYGLKFIFGNNKSGNHD
jgi:predicted alpha/beta superfamily hydrolase